MDEKDFVELNEEELEAITGGSVGAAKSGSSVGVAKFEVGAVLKDHWCKTCNKNTEFHCVKATFPAGLDSFHTVYYLTVWECAECGSRICTGSH